MARRPSLLSLIKWHPSKNPCRTPDPTGIQFAGLIIFRPFQRFKSAKQDYTGVDPHGGFLEFVKKDPINNIDTYRDSQPPPPDISHMAQKWAVGTTKYTSVTGKVTEDGKLDRTGIEKKSGRSWRNPTDNISFEPPPAADRPFQKVFDEMVTRPKFNINQCSNHPWIPYYGGPDSKTVNNRSSVGHNIISH